VTGREGPRAVRAWIGLGVGLALGVVLISTVTATSVTATPVPEVSASWVLPVVPGAICVAPDPPAYYRIDLVSTRRVPRTARSRGAGDVTFSSTSPFGIALTPDGSYRYDVQLAFEQLPEPVEGVYAVWLTTTQLDRVQPVGVLETGQREIKGTAEWNQFLVVVSLEPDAARVGARWSGPIVMRGISRSGLMHTMAGHGPFEQENCAAYGYD